MAYAVKADLENRVHPDLLVLWCDDDNDGSLDAGELAIIDDAIDSAEDLINTKLGNRYAAPFSTTPGIIKRICVDIAVWRLANRRGAVSDKNSIVEYNFGEATTLLEQIAAGDVPIPDVDPNVASIGCNKTEDDRLITMDELEDM